METSDHRTLVIQEFNHCWELREKDDRSASEDVTLLTAAFVSRYHWTFLGEAHRGVIADWIVSRAAAAIGDGELAVRFAIIAYERSLALEIPDWLGGFGRGGTRSGVRRKGRRCGARQVVGSRRRAGRPNLGARRA